MLSAKNCRYLIEPEYTFSRQLYNYREDNFHISTGFKWRRFGKDGRQKPPVAVFTSRSGKCYIRCRTADGKRLYRKYLPQSVSMHICDRLLLVYGRQAHVKQTKTKSV